MVTVKEALAKRESEVAPVTAAIFGWSGCSRQALIERIKLAELERDKLDPAFRFRAEELIRPLRMALVYRLK